MIYPLGGGASQAAQAAITAHEAAADPHPVYQTQTEADALYAPFSFVDADGTAVEVFPRLHATQGRDLVGGQITFAFFTPMYDLTVSSVRVATVGTAAAGLTLARMGLYTVSGNTLTLAARTASDTSLFTATFTQYSRSFDTAGGYPATFDLVKGVRYAFAVIATGTTMPQLYGNGFTVASLNALAPRLSVGQTGQTDLITTSTTTAGTNFVYWARFE